KFLGLMVGGFTGWIELNSSTGNDTLILIAAGYTATENGIMAGQTELLSTAAILTETSIQIFPNPATERIHIEIPNIQPGIITRIYSAEGVTVYNDIYRSL